MAHQDFKKDSRSSSERNFKKYKDSAHKYEQVGIEEPKITLDYEIQEQLFGNIAEEWAKIIENDKKNSKDKINKSAQIRRFYDSVLELNEKAQNMTDEIYKKEIFPFVIMLNSKVAYAKSRELVSNSFVKMINQCVKESTTVKKMNNFKLFFEALIGFYPKK